MDAGNVNGSKGASAAGGAQAAEPDVSAAGSAAAEAARWAKLAAEAAAAAARAKEAARARELQAKAQELAAKAEAASKRANAAATRLEEKVEARFAKGLKIPPTLQKAAERAASAAKSAKASADKARQGATDAATTVRNKPRDRYVDAKLRQLDGPATSSARHPPVPKPGDAARERYATLKERQLEQPDAQAGERLRAQAGSLAQVYSAQPERWEQVSRQMGLAPGTPPSAKLMERVLSSQVQGDIAAAAARHRVRTGMGVSASPGELVGAETQAMTLARLEVAHRNGVLAVPTGADAQVWMQGQAELAGAAETVRQSAVRTGRDPERAVAESPVLYEMRLDAALRSGELPLAEGVTPEQVAAFKQSQVTNFKDAVRISGQRGIPLEDALRRVNDCRALQQHRAATVDAVNGMIDTYNQNTTAVTRGLETVRGAFYGDGVNHLEWAQQEMADIETLEARYVELRMNHSEQELTPAQREELRGLETEIHGRLNGLGERAQLNIGHSLRHANNSQWFEQALFSTVYTAAAFVPGGVALGAGTKLLLDDLPNDRIRMDGNLGHTLMDATGSLALGAGNVLAGKVAPGSGGASAVARTVALQSGWSGASTFYEQARTGTVDPLGIAGSMAAGVVGGLLPGGGPGNVAGATWRTVANEELRAAGGNFLTGTIVDGGMQLVSTGRLDVSQALGAGRDEALSSGLGSGGFPTGSHGAGRLDGVGALSGGAPGTGAALTTPGATAGGASSPNPLVVGNRSTESVRRDLARLLLEGDARPLVRVGGAEQALGLGEIADLPTESAFAIYHDPAKGTVRLQQVSVDGSTSHSARVPLTAYQQGARPGEVLLGGLHQHPGDSAPLHVPASSADLNHDVALRGQLGPDGDALQMFILRRDSGRLVLTEFGGGSARLSPPEAAARDASLRQHLTGAPAAAGAASTPPSGGGVASLSQYDPLLTQAHGTEVRAAIESLTGKNVVERGLQASLISKTLDNRPQLRQGFVKAFIDAERAGQRGEPLTTAVVRQYNVDSGGGDFTRRSEARLERAIDTLYKDVAQEGGLTLDTLSKFYRTFDDEFFADGNGRAQNLALTHVLNEFGYDSPAFDVADRKLLREMIYPVSGSAARREATMQFFETVFAREGRRLPPRVPEGG